MVAKVVDKACGRMVTKAGGKGYRHTTAAHKHLSSLTCDKDWVRAWRQHGKEVLMGHRRCLTGPAEIR